MLTSCRELDLRSSYFWIGSHLSVIFLNPVLPLRRLVSSCVSVSSPGKSPLLLWHSGSWLCGPLSSIPPPTHTHTAFWNSQLVGRPWKNASLSLRSSLTLSFSCAFQKIPFYFPVFYWFYCGGHSLHFNGPFLFFDLLSLVLWLW